MPPLIFVFYCVFSQLRMGEFQNMYVYLVIGMQQCRLQSLFFIVCLAQLRMGEFQNIYGCWLQHFKLQSIKIENK